MKKKKLNGLSLKKNVVSRLGSSAIKGGGNDTSLIGPICTVGTRYCPTDSATPNCFSKNCEVVSKNICGETDMNCDSVQVHCL
ncbi:hypothetical protein [Aquimarina sp. Aq107]|uniref:hypothetical protein n=1 Tax=Aquimarina sp. Aq107 TaxID=1191912 RepID=UPI00131F1287|nr:hypothetical protein [Aquimarina sp. Aq107]